MAGTDALGSAWAVIMAGGSGTRFWPLSRRVRPKQFLPLAGHGRSLLAETVRRIRPLIPPERILVVTAEHLVAATRVEIPDVPAEHVLAEPVGRNTAPCVGWAAARVMRHDPEARIAVLAADHHIADEAAFLSVVERALDTAHGSALVTIGIPPTRPETGYGYLELGEPVAEGIYRARRFVEKPDQTRAEHFLASGRFLWNSGMFFFRAAAIRAAIRAHLPDLSTALDRFDTAARVGREAEVVRAEYGTLPAISIDRGVMEKAPEVLVVRGEFGWSDVGSWTTAWELAVKDSRNNAAPQDAVLIDAEGCYVRGAAGKVVALIGVRDLVIVDTEDALLVVPRERAQEVRTVVEELGRRGRAEHC
jgi:mannose-1-phosphate guanylyltransferase